MTPSRDRSSLIETQTLAHVTRRLVPLLVTCFFVAYLDRVNVSFAALTMNRDIGLSSAAFGLGAGLFFLSYSLFEIPSNLFLARVGARRWIARIMFTWGLVSGAMALVTDARSFYVLRLVLGVAEAGFFPGIIYYLTLWFPSSHRARITGYFMAAVPLSTVIGAPVSGVLLGMNGVGGMHGWQWMFILEAIPSLVMSVVIWHYLPDSPRDASWLAPEARRWLTERLEADAAAPSASHSVTLRALLNPRVLALSFVYFGAVATMYGMSFFLPQIVKAFGVTDVQTGLISAIPYVAGLCAAVYWSRRSDRFAERRFHTAAPLLLASASIALSTFLPNPVAKMAALTVAGFGIFGCLPVFWTLPTAFLVGPAAAGGIALINSIGNVAGFVGPFAMGWMHDATGSYSTGLLLLAALGAVAGGVVLWVSRAQLPSGRHDTGGGSPRAVR